jgi:hypothetical protein
MGHRKSASESIEPACSEINLTDALPHIPRVGLREFGRSIRDLPRLRADDGLTRSYSGPENRLWESTVGLAIWPGYLHGLCIWITGYSPKIM